ncbi:MAG: hypothetical protein CUN53_00990 [Phototrophicales bacterium]|nr:MAG: hypothetical protein CUN53_00990 [Phototrophicales bacterium]
MRNLLIIILLLTLVGCRESAQPTPTRAPDAPRLILEVDPDPPAVGEAALLITLTAPDGQPIDGAQITVRGDMNHAGMQPVMGLSAGSESGVYRVPFRWTMGGDWIITVTASLPDGAQIVETFDLSVES